MSDFGFRVARAVTVWRDASGVSSVEIAGALHISPSSFYSKMSGARRWNASDLLALHRLGVDLSVINYPPASPKKGARP